MEDTDSQNDPKRLMHLAKDGDTEAFGLLYELYFAPIFRYIYFRVKTKEEAEDLVQNVFLKVYKSISTYEERNKEPLAYFFTVARNTVIDYWRKKKDIIVEQEKVINRISTDSENPRDLIERKETSGTIHQAIAHLTDEQQEVIIMKFINELSNQEIAKLLGKNEAAVRQLQCRALKLLHKYLKDSKTL